MKLFIRLSYLLAAGVLFAGCSKVILVNDTPVTGSWVLTEAAQKDAYGWYSITTGVEQGVFSFYSNGTARYTEGHLVMEGTWTMNNAYGGYYDEYGNYYNDDHKSMSVHLSDYYGDNTINMYFDNVKVYANSFVATNYKSNYIERFKFSRY